MTRLHLWLCTAIVLAATLGCKRSLIDAPPGGKKNTALTGSNQVTSGPYNLNVIYFVPSDLDTVAGYRERLNGVMLHIQHFISTWMNKWGYNSTVGLPADSSGRLKLILIRGALTKSQYPYDGGSGAVMNEVNAYFTAHPQEKSSEHILVIMPAYSYGTNGDPSGGPFYGIGRWCFALDYTGLDTINLGKPDDKFSTKWIGGMAHELGHGINLPHNGGAQSLNALYGTTLMGSGNYTYGKAPTYLTPADAAILSVNQVFSSVTRADWYASPNCKVKKVYARYENGNIIVSGKFSASKAVKDIGYYHRNRDNDAGGYTSVTFESKPIGADSFYISMPLADFRDKGNTNYEFTIRFCHENGSITTWTANYAFANGVPVINFGDKIVYDKSAWSIAAYSSQETQQEDGAAINAIDDADNTYWHSRWSSNAASYPHYLVINMGATLDVNRFTFRQRETRRVKDLEILVSNDNSSWTSLGNFTLQDTTDPQNIALPSVMQFRYFKLLMKSSYDGQQFAALSEVGTYQD